MLREMQKVLVRREKRQVVANAELPQQSVDSAELHTSFTAGVAEIGRPNVIFTIGYQQRKRSKAIHD